MSSGGEVSGLTRRGKIPLHLATISVCDFRNLASVELEAGRAVTLVSGRNGAGKTSLLEAIYVLGRGRSFRSAQPRRLVREGASCFRLVASIHDENGKPVLVGMERGSADFTVRINGAPAQTLAELARLLPVLLMNPDSHRLLEGGPRFRRQFLDWGVFQAEPMFLPAWKQFRSALRNRNAALRRYQQVAAIRAWDHAFLEFGLVLDRMRGAYVERLAREFQALGSELLPDLALSLDYHAGWPGNKSLEDSLYEGLDQDRRLAHSRFGPHRAELRVSVDDIRAAGRVSRGEQKLLAAALVLAQARTLAEHHDLRCVLLVDDLPSELDEPSRHRLADALARTPAQLWLTSIDPLPSLAHDARDVRSYQIDAGKVSAMVY